METIMVDGRSLQVSEVERSREHHSRLMKGADGALFLEYPVSVGPYKIDIAVFHALLPGEVADWAEGRLDLWTLSKSLSETAQRNRTFERDDSDT